MAAASKIKRALIYTRVSQDRRGEGRSVGEQEAECRAVCARFGWEVVEVFCDNDRSASRYARKPRPDYEALVRAIEGGTGDVIVAWEASRLSRDLQAYLDLSELCRKVGVFWSYGGSVYDPDSPDDEFRTGLDALLSRKESSMTSKRVRRATAAAADAGRPHGRILYGYTRRYDPVTRALIEQIPDEANAPIVREIFARYAAGESLYAIGRSLRERGLSGPGGGRWSVGSVRRIIANPGYVARRVFRGEEIGEAMWPPLVDHDTYDTCHARMFAADRPEPPPREARYLLTGIAECGVCHTRVGVRKPRGYPVYCCLEGFHIARKIEWADEFVTGALLAWCAAPENAEALTPPQSIDGFRAARAELLEVRAELESYYEMAAARKITPAALARIEPRYLARIEALKAVTAPTALPPVVAALVNDPRGPEAVWEAMTLPDRRDAIRTLLETITIDRTGKGRRTFDPKSIKLRWTHGASGDAAPAE